MTLVWLRKKCFPTMQKKWAVVFPCSKTHAISGIWKGLKTMRYIQLHPLHQWDTKEIGNAANSRTLLPFYPAPCCFPVPSPCTLASLSFYQVPATFCNSCPPLTTTTTCSLVGVGFCRAHCHCISLSVIIARKKVPPTTVNVHFPEEAS